MNKWVFPSTHIHTQTHKKYWLKQQSCAENETNEKNSLKLKLFWFNAFDFFKIIV